MTKVNPGHSYMYTLHFLPQILYNWGRKKIAYVGHSFLYLPECPIPLLGEDLTKLNAQVTFSLEKVDAKLLLGQACILQAVLWQWRDKLQPEVPEEILQKVRADAWVEGRPGKAKTTDPVGGRLQPVPSIGTEKAIALKRHVK